MTTKIRRIIGFVLTIVVSLIAGYALAWNGNWIGDLLATTTGLITFLLGLGIIAVVLLVVFWPKKWSSKLRSILTVIVLLAALFIGGEPIREAFLAAPWAILSLLVVFGIVLWILYGLTVPNTFPAPRWLKNAWQKMKESSPHEKDEKLEKDLASSPSSSS